jgi:ATP-dependent DNA helicase RecG
MEENKNIDKKSLKFLREKQTDWNELAKDCVSFANAQGGFICIGIEDKEKLPPENQKITDKNLPDTIQKNIAQRCINVSVAVLKNIEDYRLEELIYKDVTAYPNSGFSEIHQRIGEEINLYKVRRILKLMVEKDDLIMNGEKKGARYFIKQNLQ